MWTPLFIKANRENGIMTNYKIRNDNRQKKDFLISEK